MKDTLQGEMQTGKPHEEPIDFQDPEPALEIGIAVPVALCGEEIVPEVGKCWPSAREMRSKGSKIIFSRRKCKDTRS